MPKFEPREVVGRDLEECPASLGLAAEAAVRSETSRTSLERRSSGAATAGRVRGRYAERALIQYRDGAVVDLLSSPSHERASTGRLGLADVARDDVIEQAYGVGGYEIFVERRASNSAAALRIA
jgi:hypothetical protein